MNLQLTSDEALTVLYAVRARQRAALTEDIRRNSRRVGDRLEELIANELEAVPAKPDKSAGPQPARWRSGA